MYKIILITLFLANAFVQYQLRIDVQTQLGVLILTLIIGLFGSKLLKKIECFYDDKVSFWITSFFAGLFVFYLAGFILLHRPILSLFNDDIRIATSVIVVFMCIVIVIFRNKPKQSYKPFTKSKMVFTVLVASSLIISIMTSYGVDNNSEQINIDSNKWDLNEGIIPNWGMHSDREFHLHKAPDTVFIEKFPAKRVSHRGWHVTLVAYTLLTGEYSSHRVVSIYKTLTPLLYFCLSYLLFIIGKNIFGLRKNIAGIVALTSLFFSPMKLPLLDLSPTYRGFFSASGSLYHSITHLISIPCALCGLYLIYMSLKENTQTFYYGCIMIMASFFLKPSMFTVIPPVAFFIVFFMRKGLNKDKVKGLFILLLVPIVWFSYLQINRADSAFSNILGIQPTGNKVQTVPASLNKWDEYVNNVRDKIPEGLRNKFPSYFKKPDKLKRLNLDVKPMSGYSKLLLDRFPKFILDNKLVLFLTITMLSFAAFIFAIINYAVVVVKAIKQKQISILSYARERPHIVFHMLMFFLAMAFSILLADVNTKNQDFKWAFGAMFIISLPILTKAICIIKSQLIRIISWILYLFQSALGLGYLYYFSYYSKLF